MSEDILVDVCGGSWRDIPFFQEINKSLSNIVYDFLHFNSDEVGFRVVRRIK